MIIHDLKDSILQAATEGKVVHQNTKESASDELIKILEDPKDNKKYKYMEIKNEPFQIPTNWVWVKLEDICLKITDGTHRTPKYTSDGIPFISVKDVSNGKLDFSDTKFVSKEEHEELYARCNPEYGDILITKVGTTGVPVLVDTDKQFSLFVSVALLKINTTKIYNKFLIYFLNSPVVQKQVKENTRGIGNKNWVLDAIKSTIIPLPPLEEQYRIVDKLNILFSRFDEVEPIENELHMIKSHFASDMRKSIFKSAIEGKLTVQNEAENSIDLVQEAIDLKNDSVKNKKSKMTYKSDKKIPLLIEIPGNWSKVCIGQICDITSGGTPQRANSNYWNGNIPWLKIGDINSKYINECSEYITEEGLNNSSAKWFEPGTILYTIFATIGTVGILNFRATTNQAIAGITIHGNIYKDYFYYVCIALKDILVNQGRGCAQMNINQEILSNVEIPIPPLEEQHRIVEKIEQLLPLCDDIENLVND